ncbi:hypothetical protein LCGC14_2037630 [marine sediment metagenome]|uniref:Uncharacterized protein n=1 Tax=marine sediment metagenome TaxID=412755 RepID=A0A0F9H693_9ZZZZ
MPSPQAPPKPDLVAMYWRRYQRVVRLQREHYHTLNDSGRRLLARARTVTFCDFDDVRGAAQ